MAGNTQWDALAERYLAVDPESRFETVYPFLLDRLAQLNPRNVLDVGCGDGRLAEAIRRSLPSVLVDAYDKSERMRSLAASRATAAGVRVLASDQTPSLGAYDTAVLVGVWMNWADDAECVRMLKEVRTYITALGSLLAAVTHPCFRERHFSTFRTDFPIDRYFENGTLFNAHIGRPGNSVELVNTHWNLAAMSSQLRRAGFAVRQIFEMPDLQGGAVVAPGSPWLIIEATPQGA